MLPRPHLERLWAAFPDHDRYPTLKDLYTMMGGVAERNIGNEGFEPNGNGCASRISHALNHGGSPISMAIVDSIGAKTLGTSDGTRIIFRVADLGRYLKSAYGAPDVDHVRPYDDAFRRKMGIIAFGVVGWHDASGHVALLRYGTYREPTHDNYASFVNGKVHTVFGEFWELR